MIRKKKKKAKFLGPQKRMPPMFGLPDKRSSTVIVQNRA
jgi:hypothetical protein